MSAAADAVTLLCSSVWLGLVAGISFLEAPLKFRAPDVTLALGLGIGRLVFRALNACEALLAIAVLIAVLLGSDRAFGGTLAGALFLTLLVQVVGLRPGLDRRAQAIISGAPRTPSRGHVAYIGLEVLKVTLLLTLVIQLATEVVR